MQIGEFLMCGSRCSILLRVFSFVSLVFLFKYFILTYSDFHLKSFSRPFQAFQNIHFKISLFRFEFKTFTYIKI